MVAIKRRGGRKVKQRKALGAAITFVILTVLISILCFPKKNVENMTVLELLDKSGGIRARASFRGYANNLLGKMGVDPVPAFISRFYWGEYEERITEALENFEEEDVPKLIEALQNENEDVRRTACDALRLMGTNAEAAVPALIAALKKDMDSKVRGSAAMALHPVGARVPEIVVAALIEALKDDADVRVRGTAALMLGQFETEATQAVPALIEFIELVETDEKWIQDVATESLKRIDPDTTSGSWSYPTKKDYPQ